MAEFFVGHELPKAWTCTLVVTMPKVEHPSSFKQLRPISSCNFFNKVITKLLDSRLSTIFPYIILGTKWICEGRLIHDNLLLAQELAQGIKRNVRGQNVIMELDMNKAYNSTNWFGLVKIMRKFGMSEIWIDMIWRVISNC